MTWRGSAPRPDEPGETDEQQQRQQGFQVRHPTRQSAVTLRMNSTTSVILCPALTGRPPRESSRSARFVSRPGGPAARRAPRSTAPLRAS